MTCREKLKLEHPDKVDVRFRGDCLGCPDHYGYLDRPECHLISCFDCWDREIPESGLIVGDEKIEHPDTDIPVKTMVENALEDMDKDMDEVINGLFVGDERLEHPDTDIRHEDAPRISRDDITQLLETVDKAMDDKPHILDSGNRRQFESGAVRDIAEGKGRCDLLPLDVVSKCIPYNTHNCGIILAIDNFKNTGHVEHLYKALDIFGELYFNNRYTMLLEVAKHFEEGSRKYGDNNWQKGIPVRCYIDSALRHYIKFLRGDNDEPHDRAVCWNLMCGIWTCKHKPELNEYGKE